MEMKEREGMC